MQVMDELRDVGHSFFVVVEVLLVAFVLFLLGSLMVQAVT